LVESSVDVVLFHFEVGDSVPQKSADAVVAFEYGNGVTCASELLSSGQSRGTRSNNGYGFTRQALWSVRLHPTLVESLVDY